MQLFLKPMRDFLAKICRDWVLASKFNIIAQRVRPFAHFNSGLFCRQYGYFAISHHTASFQIRICAAAAIMTAVLPLFSHTDNRYVSSRSI